MPKSKIKYIVISDIHLGAYNSLLTYIEEFPDPVKDSDRFKVNPQKTSPALAELLNCLKHIVHSVNGSSKPPQFILLGDVLELALGDINEASMTFERFLDIAYKETKHHFSESILYIPGNHDHHLWETAREKQYMEYIANLKPNQYINQTWHTTKMVNPDFIQSDLLTGILRRNKKLKRAEAVIAYPNLEIPSKNGKRSVFLTHGHFLENIYSLMSTVQRVLLPEIDEDKDKPKPTQSLWKKMGNYIPFRKQVEVPNPTSIYVLERENFAWIDFFWSTLGRSGKVGTGIGLIYDMLQDEKAVSRLAKNVADYAVRNLKVALFLKTIFAWVLKSILTKVVVKVGQAERGMSNSVLSDEVVHNMDSYLGETLPAQWKSETQKSKREFPNDYTFIFGHTHKPFAVETQDLGLKISGKEVFNTGGWVVDTIQPMSSHGGAVLFIDEDANVASFKVYTEGEIKPSFLVPDGKTNPMYETLVETVDLQNRKFGALSKSLDEEIRLRRRLLKVRIKE
ncbi:metallophosphoesterase [Leptospira neocaledonica]|uniref:Phosphoesterase n=1 Tax=Leptospira neocaledonica TaxID=2023192 RepID=A0A2M9ZV59_9LEPT|nr:metallophosphoesterase [Leptospira neocaledonica]PJZ75924.1 phosphoesterase [Leptospira neocaledonica]